MVTIRTRIKELRARYNLTQDELAEMVGLQDKLCFILRKEGITLLWS